MLNIIDFNNKSSHLITFKFWLLVRTLRGDKICSTPSIVVTGKGVSSELSFSFNTLHFPSKFFLNLFNKVQITPNP